MSDDVVAIGWVTPTLLLTPPSGGERHRAFMASLMDNAAGGVLHVDRTTAALVVNKRAIGPLPTGERWSRIARMQERAILILCGQPRRADISTHDYIRRYGAAAVTLIVPVLPATRVDEPPLSNESEGRAA